MKVILLKLLGDFRIAKGKLLLMLLAAGLSSWGISSVVYSYFMTERDFTENFLRTYPADMALTIENYSPAIEKLILSDQNVIDIERREVLSARIRDKQDNWMPVLIYAVDDINNIRHDQFDISENGNEVANRLLIEQNAYFFLRPDQDSVSLLFKGTVDPINWEVAGKVHDARQAPAMMEGVVYAYTTSIDMLEPYLESDKRRLLIKTNVSYDRNKLQRVYENIMTTVEEAGAKIIAVQIPEPGKHIHQSVVDAISFLQQSGGLVLSLMGVILLALILLTWIFPQIVDIGVMKAIGGSTSDIKKAYMLTLVIILFIGLSIGIPLGYLTAFFYNRTVAFFQNFIMVEELLPLPVHFIVVIVTLTIPFGIGILPIIRVSDTSVNNAFNQTFYTFRLGLLKRFKSIIRNTQLKYVMNNLLRHTPRTALTILLMAMGIGLYFTATNTDYSIRKDLSTYASSAQYEMTVLLPAYMNMEEVAFVFEMKEVDKVSPFGVSQITYTPPNGGIPETFGLIALSPEITFSEDAFLRGQLRRQCTECIYVSGEPMRLIFEDISLGTSIVLEDSNGESHTYRFSGTIKDQPSFHSPFLIFDDQVKKLFNGLAFQFTKSLTTDEANKILGKIDDASLLNDINLRSKRSVQSTVQSILNHLNPTFLTIKVMGLITAVLGLMGLLIVLNLTLKERTREMGIIKALGATSNKITRLVVQEFLVMGILAVAAGSVLAIPVAAALTDLVAEMIIGHPVIHRMDLWIITGVGLLVLIGLPIIIHGYNQRIIRQNAREMLGHKF